MNSVGVRYIGMKQNIAPLRRYKYCAPTELVYLLQIYVIPNAVLKNLEPEDIEAGKPISQAQSECREKLSSR